MVQGDTCENDLDGDGIANAQDNCPNNGLIFDTDFREIDTFGATNAIWEFNNEGTEIKQEANTGTAAIGKSNF